MIKNSLVLTDVGLDINSRTFSTRVEAGSLVHILGPAGSGKSSLLGALYSPLTRIGNVIIDDELFYDLVPINEKNVYKKALLTQKIIIPTTTTTVFQYISSHMITSYKCKSVNTELLTFLEILDKFNLLNKLLKPINRLAFSEWQCVRIVSILLRVWPVINPKARLLLLDEPTIGLSIKQKQVLNEVLRFLCNYGLIVCVSTQDFMHTQHNADIAWMLKDGVVEYSGKVKDVVTKTNLSKIFNKKIYNFNVLDRANISSKYSN